MPASYELRIFTADGTPKARMVDFGPLGCSIAVNKPGMLSTLLNGGHAAIGDLEHRSHVELWRSDQEHAIAPYRYFGGLYLKQEWQTPDVSRLTLSCPGYPWMLSRRINAYPANTANKTKFTAVAAETIMKTQVQYNLTSDATTANDRLRDGTNWPSTVISVQADTSTGNAVDWACAPKVGETVLDNLQKLSQVAGGDFDLVKTATNSFQFQWFTGQLGTDRSASITFALGKANMATPVYTYDRIQEATVAIVGGQGVDSARSFVVRTGTDFTTDNDSEIFVSATNEDATNAYNTAGDKKLYETRAREVFTFKIIQTDSCLYGRDYFLGDLVTAVNPYTGASSTVKISAVDLKLSEDGSESLDMELQTQ